jgi:FkbM family methyltransferase
MALHRFPQARILSVEPVPDTFRVLSANTQGQPRLFLANLAISDHSGYVDMSFSAANSAFSRVTATDSGVIQASTLDDIAQQFHPGTIDLLKIDTEGFEAHVLRGAREVLRRTRYLLIEVTIAGNENYTLPSLLSLLCDGQADWQLVALRNFADKSEGEAPILDCLFMNRALACHGVRGNPSLCAH